MPVSIQRFGNDSRLLRSGLDKIAARHGYTVPAFQIGISVLRTAHIRAALHPLANLKHPIIELFIWNSPAETLPDGVRSLQQERKKFHNELSQMEDRLSGANKSVIEGVKLLNWHRIGLRLLVMATITLANREGRRRPSPY